MTQNDVSTAIDMEKEVSHQNEHGNVSTPSKTVAVVDKECTAITSDLDDQRSNSSVS